MQKDEELAKELAKQILPLTHLSVSSKGYLICGVLDVLCKFLEILFNICSCKMSLFLGDLGKPEEALAYLDNHLNKTVQMTDLVFSIVHKLKNRLESNNQKFPFLIPDKPVRIKNWLSAYVVKNLNAVHYFPASKKKRSQG